MNVDIKSILPKRYITRHATIRVPKNEANKYTKYFEKVEIKPANREGTLVYVEGWIAPLVVYAVLPKEKAEKLYNMYKNITDAHIFETEGGWLAKIIIDLRPLFEKIEEKAPTIMKHIRYIHDYRINDKKPEVTILLKVNFVNDKEEFKQMCSEGRYCGSSIFKVTLP